jgi:hypothetical protein
MIFSTKFVDFLTQRLGINDFFSSVNSTDFAKFLERIPQNFRLNYYKVNNLI